MKLLKTLTVLALSAVATSLFAANTAKAYLTFSTIPAGTETVYSDEVKLFEDDAEVLNTLDITNSFNDYCVNAYAVYESANYSKVKIASLNNLVIKFKANNHDLNYKLTFASVSGDIVLVTADNDTLIADNDSVYDIVCTELNQELTFTVNPAAPAYERKAAINTWGTICYPKAINAITGAEVYELTKVVGNDVYGEQVTVCEAGKSYVFKATADGEQLFAYTGDEEDAPVETLGMVGNFGPADIDVPAGMYGINGTSVMEVAAGTKLKANRAYIDVEELRNVQAPARGRKIFNVVSEATGVAEIEAANVKDGKMIINGKLVIIKGGKMFNAQGAQL